MPEVEVPFTGQEVDTSDPTEGLSTIAMLIVGFAVFSMSSGIGDFLADKANSTLGGIIGVNPATGEDSSGVPGV